MYNPVKPIILLWVFMLVLFVTCEKGPTRPKTQFHTITFTNKTSCDITIRDNSGQGVFEDVVVFGRSTKKLTYECPSTGCKVDWLYSWRFCTDICICAEGYKYNQTYTFGHCPDYTWIDAEERCESCVNTACD